MSINLIFKKSYTKVEVHNLQLEEMQVRTVKYRSFAQRFLKKTVHRRMPTLT